MSDIVMEEWETMVVKTHLHEAFMRINQSREMDMCEFLLLVEAIYLRKIIDVFDCDECYDELG